LLTPNDVPASRFIERLAKYLKENVDEMNPPMWASVAKTGAHVQKQLRTRTGGISDVPRYCEKSTSTDQRASKN